MDDLQDLDNITLYRTPFNWQRKPTLEILSNFQNLSFEATINQIFALSADTPNRVDYSIMNCDKVEEYSLLEFFHNQKGRLKKFWLLTELTLFVLASSITQSSVSLTVKNNNFEFRGYERVYIKLKNGDIITRKITGVSLSEDEQNITLAVETEFDRNITISDIDIISLLLLVRMESDTLELEFPNLSVSNTDVSLLEVVKEYP